MVLTATLCNALHMKSSSKENNASAYVARRVDMAMLQIYLYQYWTWRKRNRKGYRLLDHVCQPSVYNGQIKIYSVNYFKRVVEVKYTKIIVYFSHL